MNRFVWPASRSVLCLESRSPQLSLCRTLAGALSLSLLAMAHWGLSTSEARAGVIYAVHLHADAFGPTSGPSNTPPIIPASSFDLTFSFDSASIDATTDTVSGASFVTVLLSSTDFTAADFVSGASLLDLNGVSLPAPGASPATITPAGNTHIEFANTNFDGSLSRSLTITSDAVQLSYIQQTEGPPQTTLASTNQATWTLSAPDSSATPEPASLAIWSSFAATVWGFGRRRRKEASTS